MKEKEMIKLFNKQKTIGRVIDNLCGQKLGSGIYRDVYVFKYDHRYVVKIERNMHNAVFANATEWRNYINNKDWTLLGPWMAPCLFINETGNVLVQRRATRSIDNPNKQFPKKVPACFSDLKYFNWGWIGKKFVCFDYSFLLHVPPKLVNAKWWGKDQEKHHNSYKK